MAAAMILCAGLGTRLRPLTDWLAKPMVPIGDAPAVGHIAARVRAAGFDRVVVNVHHRPSDLRRWAADAGAAISEEAELLGTAGGVARAAALLGDGDVLVWNGDILSDLDPGALASAHASSGAAATLAVVARAAGEGNVGLGEDGRIVRLRREAFGDERAGADFIGVHVLGADLRSGLPARGCLVGDVYIPALRAGARLAAHVVTTPFVDVGSLDAYVAANRAWLAARGASSWIAEGAHVSASVEGSIVGAGARVEADALRCIVWPGARVADRVSDAIVTPHGVVSAVGSR
ncbi:MAG: NTP transferase domain-containing protein [Labilithrix sp.]|nr:NTP transferase domain-containing protein [Labilithrix sp.]